MIITPNLHPDEGRKYILAPNQHVIQYFILPQLNMDLNKMKLIIK